MGEGARVVQAEALPEPTACGRHLGELKDLADRRGWEREFWTWYSWGLGGQGRAQSPGARSGYVSAVRCLLLGQGGWVKRVFLTTHPFKIFLFPGGSFS